MVLSKLQWKGFTHIHGHPSGLTSHTSQQYQLNQFQPETTSLSGENSTFITVF